MAATRLEEKLADDCGYFFTGDILLDSGHTGFQSYEVFSTRAFGKLFRLDGCLMLHERDEYLYHENLVHLPGLAHGTPSSALVIGGGDGGTAEELLKYPSMQKVVTVELDGKVIDIARQHFASVHRGAFDDARHELRVQDGLKFVREDAPAAKTSFDLICLDLTDPIGPSVELYTEKYMRECKAILAPGGALSMHLGPVYFQPERVKGLFASLRQVYRHVTPYAVYIPFYGSLWSFAVASDNLQPGQLSEAEINGRLAALKLPHLQFLTGATYRAVQAIPPALASLFPPS